jgi:hypothetical protein
MLPARRLFSLLSRPMDGEMGSTRTRGDWAIEAAVRSDVG